MIKTLSDIKGPEDIDIILDEVNIKEIKKRNINSEEVISNIKKLLFRILNQQIDWNNAKSGKDEHGKIVNATDDLGGEIEIGIDQDYPKEDNMYDISGVTYKLDSHLLGFTHNPNIVSSADIVFHLDKPPHLYLTTYNGGLPKVIQDYWYNVVLKSREILRKNNIY